MSLMNQDPNQDLLRRPFRFYFREHRRAFVMGVMALFFTNVFDVLTPLGLKAGIDAITARSETRLWHAVVLFVGLMIGVTCFRYYWRIYFGRFHHSVASDLRDRIFAKLTRFGPSFYQKNPTGQLMSLITNDVNSFRMAIGPGTLILLDSVFLIAMILPVMISISWDWTWKTLLLLPLVPFFIRHMEAMIHQRYRVQQDKLSELSARSAEIISGIRVIKGFAQERIQQKMFNDDSRAYEMACNRMSKVDSAFQPVMEIAISVGSVTLLWFCTEPVTRGAITLGTFVAYQEYIKRMIWPLSAIGMGVSMFEQGRASFDRIREVLSFDTDIPDHGTLELSRFESIEFRAVTFRYPGAPIDAIHNLSLTINAGETIGIVGPVGAGKTTLLQLLARLQTIQTGELFINQIPIAAIRRSSLASLMSFVPQDAFLFSDTVADNLTFGLSKKPEDKVIELAAAMVNIDHEIAALPDKFSAYLGERGVNLSGGQKQRMTIARALIRRTPVVILDDSLSAVDGKTEKMIVGEFRKAKEENPAQTVLIVSHRLATLKHADRIVVMNGGHVESIGSHDELLIQSPTYRRLHELQHTSAQMAAGLISDFAAGPIRAEIL